jgi:putative methionine-R-sulfoxide reductase with GAF domain
VVAVLDVDSDQVDAFNEADIEGLQSVAQLCADLW